MLPVPACQPRKPILPCACASLILTACLCCVGRCGCPARRGHCPRSPGGLKSGHWNVWYGTPVAELGLLQQPRAGSEAGRDLGPSDNIGRDPHSWLLRRRGPDPRAQMATFLQAGSQWASVWWAEELVGGSWLWTLLSWPFSLCKCPLLVPSVYPSHSALRGNS